MDAHVGDGVQPVHAGGTDGGKAGDAQTGEKILFGVANSVFDTPLFVAFAHVARHDVKAAVMGEVPGVKDRRLADDSAQHRAFEIVDHHLAGHRPEELEGVLVTSQEVFHGL